MLTRKLLVFVVGPTAVGKTAFAIKLAKHFDTEIISADSRQFFQEMNIGTAKPSADELAEVPHHFINNLSVSSKYSAGMFMDDALELLKNKFSEKDLMIVCGGSGLYLDALAFGLDEFPETNLSLRDQLKQIFLAEGIGKLNEMLIDLDPDYHQLVDQQNPQRLMRAIEIVQLTQQPVSASWKRVVAPRNFDILWICLNQDREVLYDQINQRVEGMIQLGLVEEVESLKPYKNHPALKTVGYKEIFQFLDDEISLSEAVELIKRNTRRYAKRQLTWFRAKPIDHWLNPTEIDEAVSLVQKKLNQIESSSTVSSK